MSNTLTEQQLADLESATNSLFTDAEVQQFAGLTDEEMLENYSTIQRLRLKLKAKLNARTVSNAIKEGKTESLVVPISGLKRGGPREGAGRPKGTKTRLSAATLLDAIQQKNGKPLSESIADAYSDAIERNDHQLRFAYEKMIISRVMAPAESTASPVYSTDGKTLVGFTINGQKPPTDE